MKSIISIAQIVIAVIIVILVVLQENGSGMGETFGEGGGGFAHQRRGMERGVFVATMVALALFIATSLANLII
ncbi:MAG: preprotein translocase subunit SecG [Patescibacteria group bacterium]|nr:preprotein translocase subunit SecG [Patescibacteria group bacterium]